MKTGGQRTLLFLCFCSLIACSTSYISEYKKESATKAVLLLPDLEGEKLLPEEVEELPENVIVERYDKLIVYKTLPDFDSFEGDCPMAREDKQYFLQVGSFLNPRAAEKAFGKMQQYACSLKKYQPFYHRYKNFYRVGVTATKEELSDLCRELSDLLQGTCVLKSVNSISKS
jgi:hypothetical protein